MNRKIKIALSTVLTAATVLSVTACDESSSGGDVTTNADFVPLIDYIASVKDDYVKSLEGTKNADMKVEKKVKWLSWWDIDETQAAAELFKQVYGIPEEGSDAYGATWANSIFVTNKVSYADRYTKLTSLVVGGESPDMFQFEINNYPYSAVMGLFQPIDDYIDFDNKLWDNSRDAIKQFEWQGKNYCAITTINLDSILWYKRSVCSAAGIKDPYESFNEGTWDWNTFMKVCEDFCSSAEGKYAIDGYHVADKIMATTGVPMIGIVDGQLVNNFFNADIERCMTNVIEVLAKQNYRKPRNNDVGWNTDINAWASGNILFFEGLENDIKDTFQAYIKRYKWEDNDLWFVPFPKDPNSGDTYYQSMKNDSYMLCGGAPNPTGVAAWNCCQMSTAYDKNGEMVSREQLKTNYEGYTDEWFEWLNHVKFDKVLTPVFDFKGGIGQDLVDSNAAENVVDGILNIPYLEMVNEEGIVKTFAQVRQENEGAINDRLNALNTGTL